MNSIAIALNVFFMVFFWRCATAAFEEGKDTVGWLQIIFSAGNGALLALNFITETA